MLSDEEKKAIKGLEWSQQQMRLGNLPNYDQGHYADIRIVLNLIEKQSKEIEELKDTRTIFNMGRRSYKNEIENKIKAKIEELEAIADNGANAVRFAMTHEDEIERIQKQKDIGTMVEILQSLLEKE